MRLVFMQVNEVISAVCPGWNAWKFHLRNASDVAKLERVSEALKLKFWEPIDKFGEVLVFIPPKSIDSAKLLGLDHIVVSTNVKHEFDIENEPEVVNEALLLDQREETMNCPTCRSDDSSTSQRFDRGPNAFTTAKKWAHKIRDKITTSWPAKTMGAAASSSIARAQQSAATASSSVSAFFSRYQPYDKIVAWLAALPSKFPKLCKYTPSIGKSVKGRNLPLVIITNHDTPGKPIIYVQSLIHAREWYAFPFITYLK